MCMKDENDNEITISSDEKQTILNACRVILVLEEKYKNMRENLHDEIVERKDENKIIKTNYIQRFKDIKDFIKDNVIKRIDVNGTAIIMINKEFSKLFWSVLSINLLAFVMIILNAIFKWIP